MNRSRAAALVFAAAVACLASGCTIDWDRYRVRDGASADTTPGDAHDDLAHESDAPATDADGAPPDGPGICGVAGGACCASDAGGAGRCAPGLHCDRQSQTCAPCVLAVDGTPLAGACEGVCRDDGRCVTAVQLALGTEHTCARMSDGSLRCWGANASGQLGAGVTTPASAAPLPVVVPSGVAATRVALGGAHSCGLFVDGSLRCWGRNAAAQLGDPRREPSVNLNFAGNRVPGFAATTATDDGGCAPPPPPDAAPDGDAALDATVDARDGDDPGGATDFGQVADLAAGGAHTCVLLERPRRRVLCWGDNAAGQSGVAPAGGTVAAPSELAGLCGDGLAGVSAGAHHACAQVSPTGVMCWGGYFVATSPGDDDPGAIQGDPQAPAGLPIGGASGPVPRAVAAAWGATPVGQLASGAEHTCVRAGDQVFCWGDDSAGQLGLGSADPDPSLAPRAVPGLNGVAAVAAGGRHTCALTRGGTLWCWGDNRAGQLGLDPAHVPIARAPVPVPALRDVVEVAAGGEHTCVRLASGGVRCFGRNAAGQLGEGTAVTYAAQPVRVAGVSATHLAAGAAHTCATEAVDGGIRISCWGRNDRGQLGDGTTRDRETPAPVAIAQPVGWDVLSLGRAHSCGMASDGTVYCWGAGDAGQLGNPGDALAPVAIAASRSLNPAGIAMGHDYSCMWTLAGRALCWGTIGDSLAVGGPVPVSPTLRTVRQVATRERMACVRTAQVARVTCWYGADATAPGDGGVPDGGDGGPDPDAATPAGEVLHDVDLPGSFDVTWIAAGDRFACAVGGPAASVFCWGLNTSLQLGNSGVFEPESAVPVLVSGVNDVEVVALGAAHGCALSLSGRVQCWGDNGFGQLGRGDTGNPSPPGAIAALPAGVRVREIAAGERHSCAIVGADEVYCWGSNSAGQLGLPAPRDSFAPVGVAWSAE